MKWTDEQIQDAYAGGMTGVEIAAELGVHHSTVYRHIKDDAHDVCACGAKKRKAFSCCKPCSNLQQSLEGLGAENEELATQGLRRCSKCRVVRPLEFFAKGSAKSRHGRRGDCRACATQQRNAWRLANPEKSRATPEMNRRRNDRRYVRAKARFIEHVDPLVVLELDDGLCGICGGDLDPFDFHVDHVVPLARGGWHAYDNVQAAHPVCNRRKGASVDGRLLADVVIAAGHGTKTP